MSIGKYFKKIFNSKGQIARLNKHLIMFYSSTNVIDIIIDKFIKFTPIIHAKATKKRIDKFKTLIEILEQSW